MTARAFGMECGFRGARSAPRGSCAISAASAAPKVPPATDWKNSRRSVHIQESRGVHQRMAITRQGLQGGIVLADPEGREVAQCLGADAALVVIWEAAERDEVRSLNLLRPFRPCLAH